LVAKLKFDPAGILQFADSREVPTYGIPEAAHYLRMPAVTLRSWVLGRDYPVEKGKGRKRFKALIDLADEKNRLLSFINLAEAHVLGACRRTHGITLHNVCRALDFVAKEFSSQHPLIEQEFDTDGVSLFVDHLGSFVDASARGQVVMRELVKEHLKRLEREDARVVRLYPFTRPGLADSPKSVFIDPRVSFGRPVLAKMRIPTAAITERYLAGEPIEHLAKDYDCETLDVQEAIRCEWRLETAA
jgi:uncharacterized protein (DUF433 family)